MHSPASEDIITSLVALMRAGSVERFRLCPEIWHHGIHVICTGCVCTGCGSGGREGRPLMGSLAARSPDPSGCMSNCPWARYWAAPSGIGGSHNQPSSPLSLWESISPLLSFQQLQDSFNVPEEHYLGYLQMRPFISSDVTPPPPTLKWSEEIHFWVYTLCWLLYTALFL